MNEPWWQQIEDPEWHCQNSEEQRREEEEMKAERDNWMSKEPPWWQFQDHRMWEQEQEDGLRHISTK